MTVCSNRTVGIMPFEKFPFPCCCVANRTTQCDNCCGFCGPLTGSPKVFSRIFPQPKDADAFVNVAQKLMGSK
jgi:hypothetical protein